MPNTFDSLSTQLEQHHYIADADLVTTLSLMDTLERPLLIEGDAGVGKTEIAKVLAEINDRPLIRLQCYEGLDASTAVYEWNYSHQLLSIKMMEEGEASYEQKDAGIFNESFLLERPLLQAIRQQTAPVLLIDEIDRADEAFEAFLLELLSDFQITIPELGTMKATTVPKVVLTSNGTRELSDALRRRCLYHYMEYPNLEKELRIIHARLPNIDTKLAQQVAEFLQKLRGIELRKQPGIAETLDWASALMGQGVETLTADDFVVNSSRSCLLKTQDDVARLNTKTVSEILTTLS
jgi:MoxR-like ATPase